MSNDTARPVAIEAKHLRPRLDHVSLRPDAAAAFAEAFGHRLTVICAPAGYGKTTTTAAALERCGRTAAWYKLDILDHDPLAFLAAMTRALQRLQPGFGVALLRELESGPVLDVPVEVLAARFCSECDQLVTTDHHLVLDDYHEAIDSQALNDVLGYLLENCPATVRFVVLTRYEPAFRLEKLRLAGDVARLPRDLFLFDAAQVAEVLAQRSGREHDPRHVSSLFKLTEGWPASVVLAGMALAWLDVASLEEALADPRLRGDVFSYLAEQVFQRQSDDIQRFLLATCCLEHVTGELGEAVAGSPHASRSLHYLARNHIFTFDTERAGTYRYHNLLRDFLRQRFVQEQGEAAFRALQRRTATALEDCGDRPSAVELLLGANELDLALGVISRGGEAELERRPYEQLRHWVSQLHPSRDSHKPWALAVSGVLRVRDSQFEEALSELRAAEDALRGSGHENGLYDILSITEWAEFWSGDTQASIATSNRALALAENDGQRLHTLLSLLSSAVDMKQWDVAETAAARAGQFLPGSRPEEAARAEALKAHGAYFQGDMRGALEFIGRSHSHGHRAAQRAAALNIRGMIETALGEYGAADSHLAEAAATAADFGHALTSYMIEDSRACLAGATGQLAASLSALEILSSDSAHVQEPSLQAYAICHRGTVLRRSGALFESLAPTQTALALAPIERDPYLALNAAANIAYAEGLLGEDRQKRLLAVSADAARRRLRFIELKAQLFVAVLLHDRGRKQALDLLEGCLPQQLQLGHVNLVAQELCLHPELAGDFVRRHSGRSLGPSLLSAMARSWRFEEATSALRERGPSYVGTWINHLKQECATSALSSEMAESRQRSSCSAHGRTDAGPLSELTARELEVLALASRNRSNREIAGDLFISLPTVKTHVNHILRKLNQKTRIGAILEYQRLTGASPPAPPSGINPRYDFGESTRK